MNQIILKEDCFGRDVIIDGESLFVHEYDNREPKHIDDIKLKLIKILTDERECINISEWYDIAEIVCRVSDEYVFDDTIYGGRNNRCSNNEWEHIYIKKTEQL